MTTQHTPTPPWVIKAVRKYQGKNRDMVNSKRREYYRKNKEKELQYFANKRTTLKDKVSAKLRQAVYTGKISKPNNCQGCNAYFKNKAKLHGHHKDYSKPYDVKWLCSQCHGKDHRTHTLTAKAKGE